MSFLAFTRVRHDATAASIEARATWRRLEVEVGPLVGTTPDVSPRPRPGGQREARDEQLVTSNFNVLTRNADFVVDLIESTTLESDEDMGSADGGAGSGPGVKGEDDTFVALTRSMSLYSPSAVLLPT